MALVYLLRHGDYDYKDQRDELVGQGLTSRGRNQAAAAAKWIARNLDSGFVLVCSDITRAKETAELVSQVSVPARRLETADLRECPDTYFSNLDGTDSQAAKAFARLIALGSRENVVAICHANLIRYVLSRAGNWSARRWKARVIPLCSLSVIAVAPEPADHMMVQRVASVGHLPKALRDPY